MLLPWALIHSPVLISCSAASGCGFHGGHYSIFSDKTISEVRWPSLSGRGQSWVINDVGGNMWCTLRELWKECITQSKPASQTWINSSSSIPLRWGNLHICACLTWCKTQKNLTVSEWTISIFQALNTFELENGVSCPQFSFRRLKMMVSCCVVLLA